jgi:hypothetical protein
VSLRAYNIVVVALGVAYLNAWSMPSGKWLENSPMSPPPRFCTHQPDLQTVIRLGVSPHPPLGWELKRRREARGEGTRAKQEHAPPVRSA